jgi:phage-related protein
LPSQLIRIRRLCCGLSQKRYIWFEQWSVEFLDDDVEAALSALPKDIRASFERIVGLIEAYGLTRMREPYVKHLEGPVWEMRLKGKDGIARAAYVTASARRVVIVHVFPKKTRRTPRRDIDIALRRAKEVV